MGALIATAAEISIMIQAQDNATRVIQGFNREIEQASRNLQTTQRRFQSVGQSLTGIGQRFTFGVTAPIIGAGIAILKVASDFESGFNKFEAVTGATSEQMKTVSATAKQLGNDFTLPATSAGDAIKAMTELAKAGLSVEDSLAASRGVLQLSAAANIDNALAAEIAANALNSFSLSGSEATRVADLLAATANASSSEIVDVAASLAQVSAVASAVGLPIEDVTTLIGLMANAGIKGSDAGTSLKTMLLSLAAPSNDAKTAMDGLGVSIYDANGTMLPIIDIIGQFHGALQGLTQEQRNAALATIFGTDAVRAANVILGGGVESFDAMKDSVTEEGAAAQLAMAQTKGLAGALEALQSAAETLAIAIAESGLLDFVTRSIQLFAQLVSRLSETNPAILTVVVVIAALAAAMGPVLLVAGQLAIATGALLPVLAAISPPVLIAIAAFLVLVPILILAYRHFDGLRDLLESGFERIWVTLSDAVTTFANALSGNWTDADGVRNVHRVVGNLGLLIRDAIMPAIEEFSELAGDVLDEIGEWAGVFGGATGALDGFIGALDGALGSLADFLGESHDLSGFVSGIANDLANADWSAVAGSVASGIAGAVSSIATTVTGVGQSIVDGISESLSGVDWSGVGTEIQNGIASAFGAVSSGAQDTGGEAVGIGGSIVANISTQLQDADWSGIGTTISERLATSLSSAQGEGESLGQVVLDQITEDIDAGADVAGVGVAIRSGLVRGLLTATGVGGVVVSFIADSLGGDTDWAETGTKIRDGLAGALADAEAIGEDVVAWINNSLADEGLDWESLSQTIANNLATAMEEAEGIALAIHNRIAEEMPDIDWGDVAAAIADGISAAMENVDITLFDLGAALGDALEDTDFEPFAEAINESIIPALSGLIDTLSEVLDIFQTELGPTLDNAGDAFEDIAPGIATLVGALEILTIRALGPMIEMFSAGLPPAVQIAFDSLNNLIDVIDIIGGAFSGMVLTVQALVDGEWAAAWEAFKAIYTNGAEEFRQIWGRMPEEIKIIMMAIFPAMAGALNFAANGAAVAAAAWGVVRGIASIIGNLHAAAVGAGRSFLQGLLAGLQDNALIGGIIAAVQFVSDLIPDGLKGRLGIESPSKVAIEIAQQVIEGLLVGFEGSEDEVLKRVQAIAGAIKDAFSALTAAFDFSTAASEFQASNVGLPDDEFIHHLAAFAGAVTFEMGLIAAKFEKEFLEQVQTFASAANAGIDLLSSAIDALTGLEEDAINLNAAKEAITEVKFIAEKLIKDLGDSAAKFASQEDAGFVGAAAMLAEAAMSGMDLLAAGIETLSGVQGDAINLQAAKEAVTEVKVITEKLVKDLGDSAAKFAAQEDEGFVGAAQLLAESAMAGMELLTAGIEVLAGLKPNAINLGAAKEAVTEIKFITEKLMKDLGDTAAKFASQEPEGFVGAASAFAEAALPAVELVAEALEAISTLAEMGGRFNLSAVKEAITEIKFAVEHLVKGLGDAALALQSERPEGFMDAVTAFAEAVSPAVDVMGDVLDFLSDLADLGEDFVLPAAEDVEDVATALADTSTMIATAFAAVANGWDDEVNPAIEAFSDAVGPSVDAMSDAMDFMEQLAELGEDVALPSATRIQTFATALATFSRMIADAFAVVAADWDPDTENGITAHIGSFAEAAGDALGLIEDAVGALNTLATFDGGGLSAENVAAFAGRLAEWTRIIADAFAQVAEDWDPDTENGVTANITAFAEAAEASLDLISKAADALEALFNWGKDDDKFDVGALAKAMADDIEVAVKEIKRLADDFQIDGLDAWLDFLDAAEGSLDLIKSASEAFEAMADQSRLQKEHIDVFLHNWTLVVGVVDEIAAIAQGGVDSAAAALDAAKQIAELLNAVGDAIQVVEGGSGGGGTSGGGGGSSSGDRSSSGTSSGGSRGGASGALSTAGALLRNPPDGALNYFFDRKQWLHQIGQPGFAEYIQQAADRGVNRFLYNPLGGGDDTMRISLKDAEKVMAGHDQRRIASLAGGGLPQKPGMALLHPTDIIVDRRTIARDLIEALRAEGGAGGNVTVKVYLNGREISHEMQIEQQHEIDGLLP